MTSPAETKPYEPSLSRTEGPATTYRVIAHWRDFPEDGLGFVYQPEPTERTFETLDEAERHGAQTGCLAGTTRIEVFGPDGRLCALWDKESTEVIRSRSPWWVDPETGEEKYDHSHVSSRWQNISDESKTLTKAKSDEIAAAIRANPGESSAEIVEYVRAARASKHPSEESSGDV